MALHIILLKCIIHVVVNNNSQLSILQNHNYKKEMSKYIQNTQAV